MRELRSGLWHWQAPHPEWTPEQWWPQLVSSYALDDGERLLLFDPLAVPETILRLARDREPAVVLTAPWHERDAERLVERLDAPVFTPPADTADDLVRKYGIERDEVPEDWHSFDGSRARARSSPAMRWSTSAAASKSRPRCSSTASRASA